ncbi:MAG: hypothetical protein V1749_01915 [Candidatus Desantisbacteria bacterium]
MKQIIFVAVFLSLFFTGLSVDARWIPENATPEDIDKLIQEEQEDKERIIKEQYYKEKAKHMKKEVRNVTTEGMIGETNREISSKIPLDNKNISAGVSSDTQNQTVPGVSGIVTPEQKTSVANNQEKGEISSIKEQIEIKKTGWKDWLIIGLFLFLSIGSLLFYFYSINKINKKATNRHTASKGITLVEILVATAIVAISILCILKAFQQSSLVQPHTRETTMAITLCQKKLEEIRSMPYDNLMVGTDSELINMPPYGWNGTTPINGGATRTVTITKIKEIGHGNDPPTFEGTFSDTLDYNYLKATVKMEWGTTPLKRELSVFIADRP